MNVCHVLLGKPWLHDRRVTYDGYLKTSSFVKDGKKVTLTPLALHQMPKHKSSKPTETPEKLLNFKASQHEFRPIKEWILQANCELDVILTIPL